MVRLLAPVVVGVAIFPLLVWTYPNSSASDWAAILVSVLTVMGVTSILAATFNSGREAETITNSRARVRAAERDLEAALRVAQSEHRQRERLGEEAGDERPSQPSGATSGVARLTLPELWTVTHSRLDLYHDIATGQAQRSFRNAQAAMVCGFILLIVFVAVALNASTTAGSVVAGGLGAVSAALAGFVSRTFVKSQETAAAHLRAYFDQPLEFSRYLAVERLVADAGLTSEQRAEVLTAVVQAMVTPPGVSPAQGAPGVSAAETQLGA